LGKILYGSTGVEIALDDRAMAHLQAVVATKLRRGEGFFLQWHGAPAAGDARNAAWIGPNVPLYFQYDDGAPAELRREWLEAMTIGANSNGGLQLGEEPPVTGSVPTQH
jgi:hypothetical protein